MQAALIIALKGFFYFFIGYIGCKEHIPERKQYTVAATVYCFLSGICSLPITGGFCVYRESYLLVTKKSVFFTKILESVDFF